MSAADRIEVRRGTNPGQRYRHELWVDRDSYTVLTDEQADLFDELIAAARQAPAPLPDDKCASEHCHNGIHSVQVAVDGYDQWPCPKYAAEAIAFYERHRDANPAPLPEGMEHTVMATGADILRHGWQWRFVGDDEWIVGEDGAGPLPDCRYECRPPQPEPQMVAVMLPADVARQWACGDTYADDEVVAAACRAALTEGGES